MTGEEGSGAGVKMATGFAASMGAFLHAATNAATALDTPATSQKRRGAVLKGSCLMVDVKRCEFVLIRKTCPTPFFQYL